MRISDWSSDVCSSDLKAAAGLKNICANLDHGIDPNNTVVARRYRVRNTLAQPALPVYWTSAQITPSVTLSVSETTNRSARTMRNGELPPAATSTRMKERKGVV